MEKPVFVQKVLHYVDSMPTMVGQVFKAVASPGSALVTGRTRPAFELGCENPNRWALRIRSQQLMITENASSVGPRETGDSGRTVIFFSNGPCGKETKACHTMGTLASRDTRLDDVLRLAVQPFVYDEAPMSFALRPPCASLNFYHTTFRTKFPEVCAIGDLDKPSERTEDTSSRWRHAHGQ